MEALQVGMKPFIKCVCVGFFLIGSSASLWLLSVLFPCCSRLSLNACLDYVSRIICQATIWNVVGVGLNDPYGSLQSQDILWFCSMIATSENHILGFIIDFQTQSSSRFFLHTSRKMSWRCKAGQWLKKVSSHHFWSFSYDDYWQIATIWLPKDFGSIRVIWILSFDESPGAWVRVLVKVLLVQEKIYTDYFHNIIEMFLCSVELHHAFEWHSSTQLELEQTFLLHSFNSSKIKVGFLYKCLLSSNIPYLWNENFIQGWGAIYLMFIHHSQWR